MKYVAGLKDSQMSVEAWHRTDAYGIDLEVLISAIVPSERIWKVCCVYGGPTWWSSAPSTKRFRAARQKTTNRRQPRYNTYWMILGPVTISLYCWKHMRHMDSAVAGTSDRSDHPSGSGGRKSESRCHHSIGTKCQAVY